MKVKDIKDFFKKTNSIPKKSMGQNFLIDKNISTKIAALLPHKINGNLIEIGPGFGSITDEFANRDEGLFLIEKDKKIADFLKVKYKDKYKIFNNDFITLKKDLILDKKNNWILGNLPYYISNKVIRWLIDNHIFFEGAIFTFQKDVVNRFIAKPRTKDYGINTLLLNYISDIKYCFDIKPASFYPRPRVLSSVVKITIKTNIPENFNFLKKLIPLSFRLRRKTLENNLKQLFERTKLQSLDFNLKQRAEELTSEQFIILADKLKKCYDL